MILNIGGYPNNISTRIAVSELNLSKIGVHGDEVI